MEPHGDMFHAQLHQGADKSAVVPCMLQVCMVACLAPFCHVQAHFVGSAFPPVFLLFHFWAVCGQICFFFQWHFLNLVVPYAQAMC